MREEGNAPKRGYPSRHQAAQAFPVSSSCCCQWRVELREGMGGGKQVRDSIDQEYTLTFHVSAICGHKAMCSGSINCSFGGLSLEVISFRRKDVFSKYWIKASHRKAFL